MAFSFGSTNNSNTGASLWGASSNNNTNNNNNNSSGGTGWGGSWGTNNNNNNNTPSNPNNTASNSNNNNNSSGWGASNSNAFSFGNTNTNANNTNTNKNSNGMSMNLNSSSGNILNPNNDHVVPDTSGDAISNVQFNPKQSQFIVSSWDGSISAYEYFGNNQSRKLGEQRHPKPVLSCCYDASGENVFSASCDNTIKLWCPRNNNQFTSVGQHQAPVRCVAYADSMNLVLSGSWDRSIAIWDPRNASDNGAIKPVHSVNLGHKVHAMAVKGNNLVVGLSDLDIKTFDLRNQAKEMFSTKQEAARNDKAVALKRQIRSLGIFTDNTGYVAASVGGRVIIKHFNRNQSGKDFSYKCHRQSAEREKSVQHVFAVNVCRFHPSGVFATAGDDGEIVTWDKDGRAKMFTFQKMEIQNFRNNSGNFDSNIVLNKLPIVALDYDPSGRFMLYASSYNWNKGNAYNDPAQQQPHVYLHEVKPKEVDKNKK